MATAEEVLRNLALAGQGRTMINNINNNKDNKDNNYTNFVSDENKDGEADQRSFSGLASLSPLGEALASSGTLPRNWRGVKLDLFENPGLTLKITIVRRDGTKIGLTSQMNSPNRHVFRGRNQGHGTKYHWRLVEYVMELRDDFDFRISKVSKPRKGGTVEDFVALIYLSGEVWHADLVFEHKIWSFCLNHQVSDKFREAKGIATGYLGITGFSKPWTTAEELAI